MTGFRHFLLAIQFFTRVPLGSRLAAWVGYSPAMLRASAAHFPGVGWLVGGVAAAVYALAQAGLPPLVAVLLCTAATVCLTGAFHEDGLADTADGLGAPVPRARALAIMKDSRLGSFGALALALALGLKVALLATIAPQGVAAVTAALLAGHVLSRLMPLAVIHGLPYVGDQVGDQAGDLSGDQTDDQAGAPAAHGSGSASGGGASKSKPLADAIAPAALGTAVLWSIPALTAVYWAQGALKTGAIVLALVLLTAGLARWYRARLQGFTGDNLGATQQLCELALYLVWAWRTA